VRSGLSAVNTCTSDDECREGERCQEDICIIDDSTLLSVTLEVLPFRAKIDLPKSADADQSSKKGGSSSDQEPSLITDPVPSLHRVQSNASTVKTIPIPQLVKVSGNIRYQTQRVESEIRFIPVERFPGIRSPILTTRTTILSESNSNDKSDDFSLYILKGVAYRVLVQPLYSSDTTSNKEISLPPYEEIGPFTVIDNNSARLDLDYEFKMQEISFDIQNAPPSQQMEVYAVENESREVVSSKKIVVVEEGADSTGVFTLLFPLRQQVYNYQLIIAPFQDSTVEQSSRPFPTFEVDDENINVLETNVIELPSVPVVTFNGSIQPCNSSSANSDSTNSLSPNNSPATIPIALYSTELSLEATQTAAQSSFDTTTFAEFKKKSGELEFKVDAIPGKYEVVATPSSESKCGIFADIVPIIPKSESVKTFTRTLKLPETAFVSGTVMTTRLQPVPGAIIQAQALGQELDEVPGVTRFNRSSQTTTDDAGTFKLPVDLGSYDIFVKLPEGSGFPWHLFHGIQIGGRDKEYYRDIILDSPIPVLGALCYDEYCDDDSVRVPGAELENTMVRAYRQIEDDSGNARYIAVGTATADGQGHFKLLLAPTLRDCWYCP